MPSQAKIHPTCMATLTATFAAWIACAVLFLAGCGGDGGAGSAIAQAGWWNRVLGSVAQNYEYALNIVHDGSGYVLGKNRVDIKQLGDVRKLDDQLVADFEIQVSRDDESHTAKVKDIPCDEFGIPTPESQEKFQEAVTKIKAMLDNLQSS